MSQESLITLQENTQKVQFDSDPIVFHFLNITYGTFEGTYLNSLLERARIPQVGHTSVLTKVACGFFPYTLDDMSGYYKRSIYAPSVV
jgi:hypothetical protein